MFADKAIELLFPIWMLRCVCVCVCVCACVCLTVDLIGRCVGYSSRSDLSVCRWAEDIWKQRTDVYVTDTEGQTDVGRKTELSFSKKLLHILPEKKTPRDERRVEGEHH